MNRRLRLWFGLACLGLAPAGCDYGSAQGSRLPVTGMRSNVLEKKIENKLKDNRRQVQVRKATPQDEENRRTILNSVIRLLEDAPTNAGGRNFDIAAQNLNQYFDLNPDADFQLTSEAREFLLPRIGKERVAAMEERTFIPRDSRHIEDCLLYHTIAARVAGQGEDDLTRVGALFDWVVRQVQLVPPGSLSLPGLPPAPARPYDVLLRGMATEQGAWSERSWLFMALCRQLGIDVGLLTYTPRGRQANEDIAWVCAAAIGDQAYLFDARIGQPIPGPDGRGVATLEQAATDPRVLDQLDLPGVSPYRTGAGDLAGKLTVLIDSSRGYLAPKMKLLQASLTGRNRMVLYRDPIAQRAKFAAALGPRLGTVELWQLPIEVEESLFTSPQFVRASQFAVMFFDARWPLLPARIAQLRGDPQANEQYVKFRKVPGALARDNKTPIPPAARQALDMYATYFMALVHLDQKRPDRAKGMFEMTLDMLPEYAQGLPYYYMFRWGAETNLGRLAEQEGDARRALAYDTQPIPTPEYHGNLLRARALVWDDPMAPLPAPLPPAPKVEPPAPAPQPPAAAPKAAPRAPGP